MLTWRILFSFYWMTKTDLAFNINFCRYINRLSADSRPIYRTAIFWLSTKCRPITDRYIGQVSTNYRPTIGEVSVNEKLYRPRHIWNDYRPCLNWVSTDYRPLCRLTVDRVSTECRPGIDRLSTECRPTIDRVSTDYLPSVDRYIDRYVDRYLGRHYPQ